MLIAAWIWVAFGIAGVFAGWASAGYYKSLWNWFHAVLHAASLGQPVPIQPTPPWWNSLFTIVPLGFVVVEVFFLIWKHRAATVARALRYPARHSPGWGVGCWFVPIVNLWMPYHAPRDCLRPGHPAGRRIRYSRLLFLVTSFLIAPATPVALIGATWLGIAVIGVSLVVRIAFGIIAGGGLSVIAADHHRAVAPPGMTASPPRPAAIGSGTRSVDTRTRRLELTCREAHPERSGAGATFSPPASATAGIRPPTVMELTRSGAVQPGMPAETGAGPRPALPTRVDNTASPAAPWR